MKKTLLTHTNQNNILVLLLTETCVIYNNKKFHNIVHQTFT